MEKHGRNTFLTKRTMMIDVSWSITVVLFCNTLYDSCTTAYNIHQINTLLYSFFFQKCLSFFLSLFSFKIFGQSILRNLKPKYPKLGYCFSRGETQARDVFSFFDIKYLHINRLTDDLFLGSIFTPFSSKILSGDEGKLMCGSES